MTKRSFDMSGFEEVSEDLKTLPKEITEHVKRALHGRSFI